MPKQSTILKISTALLAVTILAGCTPTETDVHANDAASKTVSNYTVSSDMSKEPTIDVLRLENSVKDLMTEDIVEGSGEKVSHDSVVTIKYVGLGAKTGEQFDTTWDTNKTETFKLDNVITGLRQGMQGMKEGGRRLIVIPQKLAYGDTPPSGSTITRRESLVFVVDLVSVKN